MDEPTSYDPNFGWQPAIPEPLWVWSWRTFSLSTPSCCGQKFKSRDDYGKHYLRFHREAAR